jgi:flagellar motor switch protein FliN
VNRKKEIIMTDTTKPNPSKPELEAWLDAWKSCTQDVLSQISGQPTVFETISETLATEESDLRYTVVAAGAVQGEMAVRLSEASGQRLANKFLGETVAPDDAGSGKGLSGEGREALEELLRQIGGLAATTVGEKVGGLVQLQLSRAEAPWAWTSDHVATLRTRDEAGSEVAIEIRISPALAAALASRAAVEAASPAPSPSSSPAPSASPTVAAGAKASPSPAPQRVAPGGPIPEHLSTGYNRLLDVGLGVKLRFGTRRMRLRDVLALSSGLVVELDNELNSPVDLLLDGRVIARGDVVIIDGKYGLRVTDVVDPSPVNNPSV